jgi:predicted RND superfamily exporter protein
MTIGFGVEKVGKLALRNPITATLLALLWTALCIFGVGRLEFDDEIRDAFRSERPEYVRFDAFQQKFADAQSDLYILFEGPDLATKGTIEALREIALEGQLVEGVEGIFSMFSLREIEFDGTIGAPVIPAELPNGSAFNDLMGDLQRHPFFDNRLLSADRRHAVIAIAMAPGTDSKANFRIVETELRDIIADVLPPGVKATVTGVPAVRAAMIEEMIRDQILLNSLGLLFAVVIGVITLHSLWAALVTAVAPLFAVLWILGGMGLAGVKINMMTNILPVLILVIAFADAMHMTFEARRYRRNDGRSGARAAYRTVAKVGPAVVLAAITTAMAFVSLALSESSVIQSLGVTGALAVMGAMLAVLVAHPLTIFWLARSGLAPRWSQPYLGRRSYGLSYLSSLFARFVRLSPRGIAMAGIAIAIVFGIGHSQIRPYYTFLDNVPPRAESVMALEVLESKLGGAHEIYLPVPISGTGEGLSGADIARINQYHRAIETALAPRPVVSLATAARWFSPGDPEQSAEPIVKLLDQIPQRARRRLLSDDMKTALISVRIPDNGSVNMLALVGRLEDAIAGLPAGSASPPRATGLSVMSAKTGEWMIGRLNYSLLAAVVMSIFVVCLAFRSWTTGLLALVPNILPILSAGAFLYFSGRGLQFTSAIALTIAFGIAIDNCVHFLSSYRYYQHRGYDLESAVAASFQRTGPALIATTSILSVGLLVTLFSGLPMARVFGWLTSMTLVVALFADMIVLPAMMLSFRRGNGIKL